VKRSAAALILFQIAALAILAPASSSAKELRSATICGVSGCDRTTPGEPTRLAERAFETGGGSYASPPTHGAPWYSARAIVAGEGAHAALRLAIVPSLELIRSFDAASHDFNWISMTPEGVRAYAQLTRGLEPFPASTLRGVLHVPARASGDAGDDPDPPLASAGGGPAGGDGIPGWALALIASAVLGLAAALIYRRRGTRPNGAAE
jgi:hypothetical protein